MRVAGPGTMAPMAERTMLTAIYDVIEERRVFFQHALLALKASEITGDYVEFGS